MTRATAGTAAHRPSAGRAAVLLLALSFAASSSAAGSRPDRDASGHLRRRETIVGSREEASTDPAVRRRTGKREWKERKSQKTWERRRRRAEEAAEEGTLAWRFADSLALRDNSSAWTRVGRRPQPPLTVPPTTRPASPGPESGDPSDTQPEGGYIPREHPQPETITLVWRVPSGRYPDHDARVWDTVEFLYDPDFHDVHVHPTGDCSGDGRVPVAGAGGAASYTFGEDEAGTTVTFACDAGGGTHCSAGQIVRFRVAGGSPGTADEADGGGADTEGEGVEESDAPSLADSGAPSIEHSAVQSLEESATPSLAPNTNEPTG